MDEVDGRTTAHTTDAQLLIKVERNCLKSISFKDLSFHVDGYWKKKKRNEVSPSSLLPPSLAPPNKKNDALESKILSFGDIAVEYFL